MLACVRKLPDERVPGEEGTGMAQTSGRARGGRIPRCGFGRVQLVIEQQCLLPTLQPIVLLRRPSRYVARRGIKALRPVQPQTVSAPENGVMTVLRFVPLRK